MSEQFLSDAERVEVLAEELARLRRAVRLHRDARGHDRCWLNDLKLYAALDETFDADFAWPDREDFLTRCAGYYDRHSAMQAVRVEDIPDDGPIDLPPGLELIGQDTFADLAAVTGRLKARQAELRAELAARRMESAPWLTGLPSRDRAMYGIGGWIAAGVGIGALVALFWPLIDRHFRDRPKT